jgi:uncharacterized iron-regulated membrane protein
MRKVLLKLHLCTALIAGIFIVLLGVTGSIIAFEQELDHLLHAKLSYVRPQARPLSLAEISAVISKEFPGERVSAYGLSTLPGLSYQVGLNRGTAYVNQYTGEILGVRQGPDAINRVLNFVHQLHLRLAIRSPAGEEIIKWVGVAIIFQLFCGLYLWWPARRIAIDTAVSSRRLWFSVHNTVGVFSFAFLLLLATTGVVVGFADKTTPFFYKMTGSEPLLVYDRRAPKFELTPTSDANLIAVDQAIEIARATLPGAAPFAVNVPGPRDPYVIRARYPEDRTAGGRSQVIVDQYSGRVLIAEGSRTAPAGSRLVTANRAIHTGDVFGLPSKTILSVASLALVAQLLSGVLIWLKRDE